MAWCRVVSQGLAASGLHIFEPSSSCDNEVRFHFLKVKVHYRNVVIFQARIATTHVFTVISDTRTLLLDLAAAIHSLRHAGFSFERSSFLVEIQHVTSSEADGVEPHHLIIEYIFHHRKLNSTLALKCRPPLAHVELRKRRRALLTKQLLSKAGTFRLNSQQRRNIRRNPKRRQQSRVPNRKVLGQLARVKVTLSALKPLQADREGVQLPYRQTILLLQV